MWRPARWHIVQPEYRLFLSKDPLTDAIALAPPMTVCTYPGQKHATRIPSAFRSWGSCLIMLFNAHCNMIIQISISGSKPCWLGSRQCQFLEGLLHFLKNETGIQGKSRLGFKAIEPPLEEIKKTTAEHLVLSTFHQMKRIRETFIALLFL